MVDAAPKPALTYAPHGGSLDLSPAEVLEWGLQRRAGIHVSTPRVVVGDDVTLTTLLLGVVPVRAYTRVLAVVDEPARRGFVYGTLPGHPERGEEAFLVTIDDDGTVRVVVQGFSRPSPDWIRVAPLLRLAQAVYTRRYLRALRG